MEKDEFALEADKFWNSLTHEQRMYVFVAVVSRIFTAEIEEGRSYRGTLYDVFGFGPEMYTIGMECGYMAIHNALVKD